MKFSSISKLLILVLSIFIVTVNSFRVVCYFDNRIPFDSDTKISEENINATLCTHLVFKIATPNFTQSLVRTWPENKKYEKIVGLKQKNPQLKVMISLPTWEYHTSQVVSNQTLRRIMKMNILGFLGRFQIDGLDLDITYFDPDSIISFVETIGHTLVTNGYVSSISAGKIDVDRFNQSTISRLIQVLDFINIQTYKFHTPMSIVNEQVDHHAPLFNRSWDTDPKKNVDSVVNKWINTGFPPNKLVIAIPIFGISWTLSTDKTNPPATAVGPSMRITKSMNGWTPYYQICKTVGNEKWQVYQDPYQLMGPYAVSPDKRTWVGYDDPAMAVVKSKYILSKGLGGAAVADVNLDDFDNRCGGGFYPITTAIYNTLRSQNPNPKNPTTNSITYRNHTFDLISYSDFVHFFRFLLSSLPF